MTKLIIAEKPSLGRTIASAFDNIKRGDGYLYNNEVVITWAFGHLFELLAIEEYIDDDYNDKKKYYWNNVKYPFIPTKFRFKLKNDSGVKNQFNTIKKLMNDKNIDEIISAGDADREGEVIIRLIIENGLKGNKKISRLWLVDQTVETIKKEYENRKDIIEYDNLYKEGLARTYIDWLIGINLTREVTVRSGKLYKLGRVVTPIVLAIYEREEEIKNFKPEKYFTVESVTNIDDKEIKLKSKEKFDKDEKNKAYELATEYNKGILKVIDVTNKEKLKNPNKLFSLSKLQGVTGKKLKMTPAETLSIVQSLYEKGMVTYPRTNTEYLSENEKDKVKGIIDTISKKSSLNLKFKDSKRVFDNSKIESHSAIIPTGKEVEITSKEKEVYNVIFNRFVAMFYGEDCILDVTEAKLELKTGSKVEEFTVKGTVIKNKGFLEVEDIKIEDNLLPTFKIGDVIDTNFEACEKETTAPKYYTVDTLNEYLKNPFRKEKKETDEQEYKEMFEGVEIGTEATRADTIDKAIKEKYISLSKNVYHIESSGLKLINLLRQLKLELDAQKTVLMQKQLKKVYRNEIDTSDAVKWSVDFIEDFFENSKDIIIEKESQSTNREVIAKCPLCRSNIYENTKGYSCSNSDCRLTIWKNESFITHFGKSVNKTIAKNLFEKKAHKFTKLKGKKGEFDAIIKVVFKDPKTKEYSLDFK